MALLALLLVFLPSGPADLAIGMLCSHRLLDLLLLLLVAA
jgi:hypothetical protein